MAAVTPSATLNIGPLGQYTLKCFTFANTTDDGDTWASGLSGRVIRFWSQDTDNPTTQGSAGVAVSESSGTFTFYPAEDNKSFYLYVLLTGS